MGTQIKGSLEGGAKSDIRWRPLEKERTQLDRSIECSQRQINFSMRRERTDDDDCKIQLYIMNKVI